MSAYHKDIGLIGSYNAESENDGSMIKTKPKPEPKTFISIHEIFEGYIDHSSNIDSQHNLLSHVKVIPGACPTCWNLYARAIPLQEGKPCFRCGSE